MSSGENPVWLPEYGLIDIGDFAGVFPPSDQSAFYSTFGGVPEVSFKADTSSRCGSKASREKMRRDKLNDRFMEPCSLLNPTKKPRTDKALILSDAIRIVNQLRSESKKLTATSSPKFIGSSGRQWPFLNKAHPLMFIKGDHVADRASKAVLAQSSSSILQPISTVGAFDARFKTSAATKMSFTLDTHSAHFLPESKCSVPSNTHPIPVKATASCHPSETRSNNSISTSIRSPYSKFYGPSVCTSPANLVPAKPFGGGMPITSHHSVLPVVAATTHNSRSVYSASVRSTSPAAQLTIFYAGSVNVYDNVPLEKVQSIMSMMENQPPIPSNIWTSKLQTPSIHGFNGNIMASATSGLPNPASGTAQLHVQLLSPHSGVHSSGGSRSTDELIGVKVSPFTSNIQHELLTMPSLPGGAAFISQGAVPQARKASLARFLEKRKERVLSTGPYSKKPEASHVNDPAMPNATSSVAAKEDGATS